MRDIETAALDGSGLTTVFEGARPAARRLRKGKLVVIAGPDVGREVEITRARCSAGRSVFNDLVLEDRAVSGTHFEIEACDEGFRLRDLDSRTGTFVGDLRIREVYLQPGMTFRAGQTEIRYQPQDEVVEIELSDRDRFGQVMGTSARMREIFAHLEKVAQSELTCLIAGETGTGKELIARGIHDASPRSGAPFVVLDCGAIPRELIESTLFGHERGSFTGAVDTRRGCFEQADGGTILLDEIGELDVSLQPKLLRVLEQRELQRVGGRRTISVDVRVLAATNRDLRAEVNAGCFREDLYYRLSVVQVELPPLRERREDIPGLAQHFLRAVAARRGLALAFDPAAMSALVAHPWPGNVRELRNVVERAAALGDGSVIARADLVFGGGTPRVATGGNGGLAPPGPGTAALDDAGIAPAGTEPAGTPTAGTEQAGSPAAGTEQAGRPAAGTEPASGWPIGGPAAVFDPALFTAAAGFKQSKQAVVDAFEAAYLRELLARNEGNITRAALQAGLTRYHLRELLKRHQIAARQG